jgi:hypothetical protein
VKNQHLENLENVVIWHLKNLENVINAVFKNLENVILLQENGHETKNL